MKNDLYYGSEAHWGIGVVEDVNDPLQAGRVRVRIYGIHTPDINELPTSDLPWSQVMMPMNSASLSGAGTSPVGVQAGSMVYGVFLDAGSYQQFLVQGTMPGIRKSSEVQLDFSESSIFNSPVEDFGDSKPEQLFNIAKAKGADENLAAGLVAIIGKFTNNSYDPESTHSNNRFGIGKFNEVDRQRLVDRASSAGVTVFDYKIQAEYLIDRVTEEARSYFSEIDSVNSLIRNVSSPRDAVIAILQNVFRESTATDLEQIQNSAEQAYNAFSSRPNSGDIGAFESKAPAQPLGKFSIIETQENLVYYLENARDERLSGSNRIRGLIVHHTDTFENMNSTAEDIDDWHLEKGFSEIGYHIVLLRDGRIQIGRLATKTGAHALKGGFNSNTIGLAFVGGRTGDSRNASTSVRSSSTFTALQWRAFDQFLQAWLQVFPDSFQKGHRDTDPSGRTDPEFNVEEYVASRYSEWKAIPAEQEQPTEQATITEVPTDPTTPPVPSTNSPEVASEPTDTSAVESAPSGPIVLPDFDPTNFPTIPDPNDTPILDLGDLLGGGGGGGGDGGDADTLNGQPGSYYLNFTNFTNVPSPTITAAGDISGSVTLTSLNSATFTMDIADDVNLGGTPTAATATPGTNTTQIATTAFVTAAVTAAGGGDVSKVGTPVDNQIGVWTGDGTIEGDANLTWDASQLAITGTLDVSGTMFAGQISLDGTRTITSNTGNGTMQLRMLGRTTAGTAHIIGDTANNVMSNSSGDTINLSIDNTVNQTGTAGHTDLLINRTETAVGSGNQYLLDAQVDGTSLFNISNAGVVDINVDTNGPVLDVGAHVANAQFTFVQIAPDTYSAGGNPAILEVAGNRLGTANPDILRLMDQVNGTELFSVANDGQVYSTGSVGVGTDTPTNELTVDGDGRIQQYSGSASGDGVISSLNLYSGRGTEASPTQSIGVDATSQPSQADINFVVETEAGEADAAALKFVAGGTVSGNGTMSSTGTSSEIQVFVSNINETIDRVWTFRGDGAIAAGDGTNGNFRITQTGFENLAQDIGIAQTYGLVYSHPSIGGSFIPGTTNGTLVESKANQYYQIDSDNSTTGTAFYSWRADGNTIAGGTELMNLNEDGTLTLGGDEVAVLASPAFTGTPTAPTASPGTNTTQIATTAFVTAAVGAAGGGDVTKVGTPADNQIGVWTGDGTIEGDANLTWDASTLTVNGNTDLTGGTATATTQSTGTDNTTLATTAFVQQEIVASGGVTQATFNTTSTTQAVLYSFSASTYGGGEFLIVAHETPSNKRHLTKILVTHDGTTATGTEYGIVYTSNTLASYDVDINGGNVRILVTAASGTNTDYDIQPTLLVI